MSDYLVVADFTGYPRGSRRDFKAGQPLGVPADMAQDYADLLVSKGHVTEVKAKKEASK